MHTRSESEASGCTVGIVHIPGGILFFKNRDLAAEHVTHRVTIFRSTPDTHALSGVNLKTKEPEGVSIGVNRHRICVANTHITSTTDVTYDVLCAELLHGAQRQENVPRIVQDFMARQRVQGGRILVASPQWAYLVEVFKDRFEIQEVQGNTAITNDFSLLRHRAERSELQDESSATRLQVATSSVQTISSIKGLKSMLRSHIPERGQLSICSHWEDGGGTESSHIIQIQGDYAGWSSLIGFPCENDYRAVPLFVG
jgi:hypothetical protein